MQVYNQNNMDFRSNETYDIIYCDMLYENLNFSYVDKFWTYLKPNGIFCIQTDYHSVAEIKVHIQTMQNAYFLNWLTWKNEFGNFKHDRYRQCHDDILIFCNGQNWVWHPEKIQVPKVTAKAKGLNKSGRETKLATSVITDICLTTIAKERIKKEDGHNIRWQKPQALYSRILEAFLDKSHNKILDVFMGSGSLGRWSVEHKDFEIDYTGIELDKKVFDLAVNNIKDAQEQLNNKPKYIQETF